MPWQSITIPSKRTKTKSQHYKLQNPFSPSLISLMSFFTSLSTNNTTHNAQRTTHNTQHTTHNTQHTTHNTTHTQHNTTHEPLSPVNKREQWEEFEAEEVAKMITKEEHELFRAIPYTEFLDWNKRTDPCPHISSMISFSTRISSWSLSLFV